MRKIFRLIIIYITTVYVNRLEVIINRNLSIELDRSGAVFIRVTVDMLDLGKMTLARGGTKLRENYGSIHNIDKS